MWFIESVLLSLALMLVVYLAGQPLLLILSRENKFLTVEKYCLSLMYGTLTIAYLFLIATYLNLPGKYVGLPILSIILLVSFFLKNKLRYRLQIKKLIQFILVCLAAIFISLITLLIYNSITPYNDTFGYINISDYLYNHGFLKKYVDPDGFQPLNSLILILQGSRARMGANFFLAALQSMVLQPSSIFVFPVAQAWGLILNLASIAVASRWMFNLKWKYTLIALILVTVTFNPIYYSIHYGFYNQNYGCAFLLMTLAAFTRLLQTSNSHNAKRFVLITAIFLSALIFFYPELFLFAVLSISISMFLPFLRLQQDKRKWIFILFCTLCMTIIISNINFVALLYFLPHQIRVVSGWNLNYSTFQFLNIALGVMPLVVSDKNITLLGLILLSIFLLALFKIFKKSTLMYCPWLSTLFIFFVLFIYFKLFVVNPWVPNTLGQTWNMFKIVSWAFPLVMIGLAYGISQLHYKKITVALILILSVWAGISTHPVYYNQALLAQSYTKSKTPFIAYQQFADEVKKINTDQPIELVSIHNHRKMLAYFLKPKAIISDWRDDIYMHRLRSEFQNIQWKNQHYIIIDSDLALTNDAKPLPANMLLINSTKPHMNYFKDTYDAESSAEGAWRWSSGKATIGIIHSHPERLKIQFNIYMTKIPSKLTINLNGTVLREITINKADWNEVEFSGFFKEGQNVLALQSDNKPITIGSDTRLFAFCIKNIKVDDRNQSLPEEGHINIKSPPSK